MGGASSVKVRFEYGPSNSYGTLTAWQTLTSPGTFNVGITGLSPMVTYHVRAKADGGAFGLANGLDVTFTTGIVTGGADVVTAAATNITSTSATLNGKLLSLGMDPMLNVSFQHGLTTSYGQTTIDIPMTSAGSFSVNISGLIPATTYHFRARAFTQTFGFVNAADVTFTTATAPPSVSTISYSSLTATSVTLHGILTSRGSAPTVNVFFEYGPTNNYGYTTPPQSRTNTGDFVASVTGLKAGSGYYFRARAESIHGTAYGPPMIFTTPQATYELTVGTSGSGSGSVDPPAGIYSYQVGTSVAIKAVPAAGWRFVNWTGDVIDPDSAVTETVISQKKTVTANFSPVVYDLAVSVNGKGTVSPHVGSVSFPVGTTVNVVASPERGWVFSHWSGDVRGENPGISLTIDAGKSITAHFAPEGITLISAIRQTPAAYDGRSVVIVGAYRGWEPGHGQPPVTRSDWVVWDSTSSMYVTGGIFTPRYPEDVGKLSEIRGTVRFKNGEPYLDVPRQRLP